MSDPLFRYTKEAPSQTTLRRKYDQWRKSAGIPIRCDNEVCRFHTEPLVWNGEKLKLILDHKEGVNSDNRLDQLRLLCPNCNQQTHTFSGKNRGRVRKSEGGFAVKREDGLFAYAMPMESGSYKFTTR